MTDDKGVTHIYMNHDRTVCGREYVGLRVTEDVVTCFVCMHPRLSKDCGHRDAQVRNCPKVRELWDDYTQRCNCCSDCAYECRQDI